MIPSITLQVDQDKARSLGINPQNLSRNLNTILSGLPIMQYREGNKTIDVLLRANQENTGNIDSLKDISIYTDHQRFVPLGQIAYIDTTFEEGIVWRRNHIPAITVRADIIDGVQAPDVTAQINHALVTLRAHLPNWLPH